MNFILNQYIKQFQTSKSKSELLKVETLLN